MVTLPHSSLLFRCVDLRGPSTVRALISPPPKHKLEAVLVHRSVTGSLPRETQVDFNPFAAVAQPRAHSMATNGENSSFHPRAVGTEHPSVTNSVAHELEEVLPGQRVSVFTLNGKKYFVGVQLATLLKRETFNLYRSMKIKNVGVSR